MKRVKISLDDIASFDNLCLATVKAARGKRTRPAVVRFTDNLDANIRQLRDDILEERAPRGIFKCFTIHDPKKRLIHAACFEDRILHHGVMNLAGPVLDRAMVPDTYACREGKGILKAVGRVQDRIRQYPWVVKIDIQSYFDAIDHGKLYGAVADKFKGREFLSLMERIIRSCETRPGRGIPIGSLTSQHLANYYLDGLDRYIMEALGRPYVRYMDDMVWWCHTRQGAKETLGLVKAFVTERLGLQVKPDAMINRSERGLGYCGFRIYPGCVKPGKRQLKRFFARRKFWEGEYERGAVTGPKLQCAYESLQSFLAHADSREWRKRHFKKYPPPEV